MHWSSPFTEPPIPPPAHGTSTTWSNLFIMKHIELTSYGSHPTGMLSWKVCISEMFHVAVLNLLTTKPSTEWHLLNFNFSVFRPYKMQQCSTELLQRKFEILCDFYTLWFWFQMKQESIPLLGVYPTIPDTLPTWIYLPPRYILPPDILPQILYPKVYPTHGNQLYPTPWKRHGTRNTLHPKDMEPGTRKDLAPEIPYPLPVDRMTNTCEKIIFLQLHWWSVNIGK